MLRLPRLSDSGIKNPKPKIQPMLRLGYKTIVLYAVPRLFECGIKKPKTQLMIRLGCRTIVLSCTAPVTRQMAKSKTKTQNATDYILYEKT